MQNQEIASFSKGNASKSWLLQSDLKSSKSSEFFSGFLRNCINCVHNCEDHSSFDLVSAVLIWFISHTSISFISWTHNWLAPNISGFTAQLVRASHQYHQVTGSNPVEVLNFFRLLTQLHKLRSLRGSFFICWMENFSKKDNLASCTQFFGWIDRLRSLVAFRVLDEFPICFFSFHFGRIERAENSKT